MEKSSESRQADIGMGGCTQEQINALPTTAQFQGSDRKHTEIQCLN